jgi:Acetyltransferase (GNAT) domain
VTALRMTAGRLQVGYGELIAIEYHADLKEVQLDARLAALLSPAQQKAPFDRLDWLRGLATSCKMEPMVAAARDDDALVVLPLSRSEDQFIGLSNYYTFRFRPLISGGGDTRALLNALARDLASKTHRITLTGVPEEDGSASLLEAAFQSAGWTVLREQCDWNHVLPIRGRSWAEYFESLPGQLRSTIKRKQKNLECQILDRFDEVAWAHYVAIYDESWKPEEGSIQFLREFALAESARGHLRLGVARFNGEAVAAQIWTVENGTAFIHKLAYRSSAGKLSPGSVLSAAMFERAIETDKVGLIDYGIGDDSYKRDWMEEVRPRYRLDMFRPGSARNWIRLAKSGLARLAGKGPHS